MIMTWVTPRLDIGGGQDLFCPSCAKIEENAYKTLQAALLLDGWLIWQVYGGCKGATLGLRLLLHSPRKGIWVNYGDFLLIGPKQKYIVGIDFIHMVMTQSSNCWKCTIHFYHCWVTFFHFQCGLLSYFGAILFVFSFTRYHKTPSKYNVIVKIE